jgi:dipeptidyl aminopeptidase/acylaminoacyl peptidase
MRWKLIGTIFVTIAVIVPITWALGGFRRSFDDITSDVERSAQPLSIPRGSYGAVAWLAGNQLAFVYSPTESSDHWDDHIMLYSLATKQWRQLNIPKPAECRLARPRILERLPNGNLGFIYTCLVDVGHGDLSDEVNSLYMWDIHTERPHLLQRYPTNFRAGPFAFAPDLSELIQERTVGNGLNNQLYRVMQDGRMERLFSTWQRVAAPGWSPSGRQIAFVGTETYPERKPLHPLFGLGSVTDLLYYPWDLYVMDAHGGNLHMALKGIQNAVLDNWSPQGTWLTFTGTYKRTDGIWTLDLVTGRVTRVWPNGTISDWSPDGRQMVIQQQVTQDGVERDQPTIVDIALPKQ